MVTKRKASATQPKKTKGTSAKGAQAPLRPATPASPASSARQAPSAPQTSPSRPAPPASQTPPVSAPVRPTPPMRPVVSASAARAQSQKAAPTGKRVLPAKPAKQLRRRRKWPWVVGAILVVLIVAVGLFSWNRWYRYDDAQDFLGDWLANDTTSLVVIDGETIRIADDVAYDYTIDSFAKTISYSFGSMKGSGRYWFSEDRQQLVITDGGNYNALTTLIDDVSYDVEQLKRRILGQTPLTVEPTAGSTLLSREGADQGQLPTRPTHDEEPESDEAAEDGAIDGEAATQ